MRNLRLIFVLAAICLAPAPFAQSLADKSALEIVAPEKTAPEKIRPEKVIRYRQSAMAMIGWNSFRSAPWSRAGRRSTRRNFRAAPIGLEFLGPQLLEGFSKGSDSGAETDAKPEIWTNFDNFQALLNDYVNESRKLADVARNGSEADMKEQFRKTAESCKALPRQVPRRIVIRRQTTAVPLPQPRKQPATATPTNC